MLRYVQGTRSSSLEPWPRPRRSNLTGWTSTSLAQVARGGKRVWLVQHFVLHLFLFQVLFCFQCCIVVFVFVCCAVCFLSQFFNLVFTGVKCFSQSIAFSSDCTSKQSEGDGGCRQCQVPDTEFNNRWLYTSRYLHLNEHNLLENELANHKSQLLLAFRLKVCKKEWFSSKRLFSLY